MLERYPNHKEEVGGPIPNCDVESLLSLEERLSITTGRCDLPIATHARKMHKNLFMVVHPEVLDND
jgi:hypothetical protein